MASAALKTVEVVNEVFADELKPGTQLLHGQFTIESFLNSGGFGITHLARDSLDRLVVIKECFPGSFCRRSKTIVGARSRAHQVEFRTIVKLFVQEAFNLSKLKHPHIVGVHQVFEDNETAYMAMDYIEGFDLLETVEDGATRLGPDQIVAVLKKVLGAVGYVHSKGVLHRDISPDNILMDKKTGNPVLIDFGAAREEVSRVSRALSAMRVVKDGYSPQEFYIKGSAQGPYSDLYALAATFYHLITGNTPTNSQSRLAAVASREPDPYVALSGSVKGYPPAFLKAIDKALNVFPKDRIQTADAWLEMITPGADEPAAETVAARPPTQRVLSEKVAVATAVAARSPRFALVASASAAVLVAGLGLWLGGLFAGSDPSMASAVPAATGTAVEAAVAMAPVETVVLTSATRADAILIETVTPEPAPLPITPVAKVPVRPAFLPEMAVAPVMPTDPGMTAALDMPIVPAMTVALDVPVTPVLSVAPQIAAVPQIAAAPTLAGKPAAIDAPAAIDPAVASVSTPVAEAAALPAAADATGAAGFTRARAVGMTFGTDAVQKNRITSISSGAPLWMQPGQLIVEVNGVAVRPTTDLREIMGRGAELSGAAVQVIFGVQAFDGADTIRKTEILPVVEHLVLDTGLTFEVRQTEAGPQTVVSAVPRGVATDLQPGDVLVSYSATSEKLDAATPLSAILSREIANSVTTYGFAVEREGGMIDATFTLNLAK